MGQLFEKEIGTSILHECFLLPVFSFPALTGNNLNEIKLANFLLFTLHNFLCVHVLGLAGTEFPFPTAAHTVLRFALVARTVLMAHPCSGCC